MRIGSIVLVVWLLIGVLASAQRGYFSQSEVNCAEAGTVIVAILAGPLNYVGANPKIDCKVPQPSN
ncbi:MAG TPA: hypothetical protein VF165_05970 [Nocardioidaceae bacterium]